MNRDELLTRLAMGLAEWPSAGRLGQHLYGWPEYSGLKFVGEKLIDSDMNEGCMEVIAVRRDWLAERERLINKPRWDDAPEWADKLLQQDIGDWYWCKGDPQLRSSGWNIFSGFWNHASKGAAPAGHDWQDTLEQRPVTQTADPIAEDDAFRECAPHLREAELTHHITPAELVNRQLIQRCDELQESNARLADENQRLRRTIGELCA